MSCLPGPTGSPAGCPPTAAREGRHRAAAGRVPVTLAASADGEVRQRVVSVSLIVGTGPVEHDPNVGGRHPVLQDRAGVELPRRRSTLEGDERHPGAPATRHQAAAAAGGGSDVGTERLLLVGSTDYASLRTTVLLATLRRVEVERRPRTSVVGTLVDCHGVRGRRTELQADVCRLYV